MASRPNDGNDAVDMTHLITADEDIVRAVLMALCQDGRQERKAIAHFKKLQQLGSGQHTHADNTAAGSTSGANAATSHRSNEISNGHGRINGREPTKRRAASEIRICDQCQEAFSEDDNPSDACLYHPGSSRLLTSLLCLLGLAFGDRIRNVPLTAHCRRIARNQRRRVYMGRLGRCVLWGSRDRGEPGGVSRRFYLELL